MKTYNKLVRDRIPEIIEANGHNCEVRILSEAEYVLELKKKLLEEVAEYLEEGSIEELADILEVLHSLAVAYGSSIQSVEEVRLNKASERGSFDNKVFLKTVDEC